MDITCPQCAVELEAPESDSGSTAECPACGTSILVQPRRLAVPSLPIMDTCPVCQTPSGFPATMQGREVECRHCGGIFTLGALHAPFDVEIHEPHEPSPPARPAADDPVTCPACGSTQLTAMRRGMSLTLAAGGVLLFGALGALAGAIGRNTIQIACHKCGHSWTPTPAWLRKLQ